MYLKLSKTKINTKSSQ